MLQCILADKNKYYFLYLLLMSQCLHNRLGRRDGRGDDGSGIAAHNGDDLIAVDLEVRVETDVDVVLEDTGGRLRRVERQR